jgi:hypothetical protein
LTGRAGAAGAPVKRPDCQSRWRRPRGTCAHRIVRGRAGTEGCPTLRTSPSVSGSNMRREGQISSCRQGCTLTQACPRPLRRGPCPHRHPGVQSVAGGQRWLDEWIHASLGMPSLAKRSLRRNPEDAYDDHHSFMPP